MHLSVAWRVLNSNKISVVEIVQQTNANPPAYPDIYGGCVFQPASVLFAHYCSILHRCFQTPQMFSSYYQAKITGSFEVCDHVVSHGFYYYYHWFAFACGWLLFVSLSFFDISLFFPLCYSHSFDSVLGWKCIGPVLIVLFVDCLLIPVVLLRGQSSQWPAHGEQVPP